MNGTTVTLDAQVILTWVTLVVAVVGAVVAVARWTVRTLRHIVEETTAPIQPTANGGGSLPDLHRAVQSLARENETAHRRMHERIDVVVDDVRDLQMWAGDRPCLLDVQQRQRRARQRLREDREAGSNDDAACEHDA